MVLVMIGWVFFRAGSTRLAIGYFAALAGMGADPTPSYNAASFMRSPSTAATIMVIAIVLAFPVRQAFERRVVANLHGPWRGVALALAFAYASLLIFLFIVAISLVAANTYNPFLYFRF
jgi:alginate O-acetyltransferase complex protein AlgI